MMISNFSANTARHLPLYGGGWEGVREPRHAGQPSPSLTLPARGRVTTDNSVQEVQS